MKEEMKKPLREQLAEILKAGIVPFVLRVCDDTIAVSKLPGHVVDPHTYLEFHENGQCAVCAAGSFLLRLCPPEKIEKALPDLIPRRKAVLPVFRALLTDDDVENAIVADLTAVANCIIYDGEFEGAAIQFRETCAEAARTGLTPEYDFTQAHYLDDETCDHLHDLKLKFVHSLVRSDGSVDITEFIQEVENLREFWKKKNES